MRAHYPKYVALVMAVGVLLQGSPANAQTVVQYTYDRAGRVTTALYDNGTCVIYTYDANGNRTAKTILAAGSQNTSTWGTGLFGCFKWS